jgi:hypothetical protein
MGNALAYLDLQDVVTADALVVHLVVRIIGVATILILNKCEPIVSRLARGQICRRIGLDVQPAAGTARGRDVAAHETAKARITISVSISVEAC